jgi:hypothetical protein
MIAAACDEPPRRPNRLRLVARPAAYLWAAPNTLLGLALLPLVLATGGRVRVERGAVELHGGFARFFLRRCLLIRASALTLGHVILGQDLDCLDHARDHEHVHVRQYERWGPLFLPAYFLSSFWCWRKGKNPYLDNLFEIEAYGKFP